MVLRYGDSLTKKVVLSECGTHMSADPIERSAANGNVEPNQNAIIVGFCNTRSGGVFITECEGAQSGVRKAAFRPYRAAANAISADQTLISWLC